MPAEDVGADTTGVDIDFSAQMVAPIRKPDQFERFVIAHRLEMTTYLLVVRSGAGGIETKYYHLAPELRHGITGLKAVTVVPWWSCRDKRWNLWISNYNPGGSWHDSLQPLLQQDDEFYRGKEFTVESNRALARYDLRWYPTEVKTPTDPSRPVSQMLGQSLGEKGFIRNPDHPVYQALTSGEPVF